MTSKEPISRGRLSRYYLRIILVVIKWVIVHLRAELQVCIRLAPSFLAVVGGRPAWSGFFRRITSRPFLHYHVETAHTEYEQKPVDKADGDGAGAP